MPRGATPTTHIVKLPIGMVGGIRAARSACGNGDVRPEFKTI
jgi:hypothetical protein